MLCSLQDK